MSTHTPIDIYKDSKAEVYTAGSGLALPYRLFLPADFDPEKVYPMLVFLHGAGERGVDNTAQLKHVIPAFYADADSPIYGAFVICPQCPGNQQWVSTPWAAGDYRVDDVPQSQALSAVVELITDMQKRYKIDAGRIYAMGISMGGYGTWDLIMRHTELFAAAVPICGAADTTKAALLKDMPIRTFHGLCDAVVPCHGTARMALALKNAGSTVFEVEFLPEWEHNSWCYAASKKDLLPWLFAQSK